MFYITSYKAFRMSIWVRSNPVTIDQRHLCGYVEITKDEYKKLSKNKKSLNIVDNINIDGITYGELNKDFLLEDDERFVTIGIDLFSPYYLNNGLYMEPIEAIKNLQFVIDDIIDRIGMRTEEICKEIDSDLICQLSDEYEYPIDIIATRAKSIFNNKPIADLEINVIEDKNDLDEAYHTFIPKE